MSAKYGSGARFPAALLRRPANALPATPSHDPSPPAPSLAGLQHIMMYSMTIFASLLGSALGFSSIPDGMKIPCSTPVTVTVTVTDTWCRAQALLDGEVTIKGSHPHDFMENIGGDGPINGPFIPPDVKAGAHTSPTVVYTHGASTEPVWGEYADQGGAKVLKMCLVLVAPQHMMPQLAVPESVLE